MTHRNHPPACTRADYAAAMKWLAKLEITQKEWTDEEAAVRRILLSLPEPAPRTVADLTDEELHGCIGCAVEHDGDQWWLLGISAFGEAKVLRFDGLVPCAINVDPGEVTLLPDGPRMTIPGVTVASGENVAPDQPKHPEVAE